MSIPGRETSQGKCKAGNDPGWVKNLKKASVVGARGEWREKEEWLERRTLDNLWKIRRGHRGF